MKKRLVIALLVVLAVSGCGWLINQTESVAGAVIPKAQICPDDPMACR